MVNLMLTKLMKIKDGIRAGFLKNSLITGRKIMRFTSCNCSCFIPVAVVVVVASCVCLEIRRQVGWCYKFQRYALVYV
jgi:hypothetical protein